MVSLSAPGWVEEHLRQVASKAKTSDGNFNEDKSKGSKCKSSCFSVVQQDTPFSSLWQIWLSEGLVNDKAMRNLSTSQASKLSLLPCVWGFQRLQKLFVKQSQLTIQSAPPTDSFLAKTSFCVNMDTIMWGFPLPSQNVKFIISVILDCYANSTFLDMMSLQI